MYLAVVQYSTVQYLGMYLVVALYRVVHQGTTRSPPKDRSVQHAILERAPSKLHPVVTMEMCHQLGPLDARITIANVVPITLTLAGHEFWVVLGDGGYERPIKAPVSELVSLIMSLLT